jgi:hypothetical protein
MPMSAAAATEAIVRYDMRVPFLDFLSPDMFRSEATGTRMGSSSASNYAYAFVRLESEQNSSRPTPRSAIKAKSRSYQSDDLAPSNPASHSEANYFFCELQGSVLCL